MGRKKLVCGRGHNDADYVVHRLGRANGKWKIIWTCPYYRTWVNMLRRCFKDIGYEGCIVCKEWLTFSNFRLWMRTQQWIRFTDACDIETLHLDKDFLSGEKRGKLYSPDVCVFVPASLNKFLIDSRKSRGNCPLGVFFNQKMKKYIAQISNPFTEKYENLGCFDTPDEAQLAYIIRKTEFAARLAAEQTDARIAQALLRLKWI